MRKLQNVTVTKLNWLRAMKKEVARRTKLRPVSVNALQAVALVADKDVAA
jgi:urease gamma subunit